VVPATATLWLLATLTLPFSRRGVAGRRTLRAWSRILVTLSGSRFVVSGLEHVANGESCVVVANHASYLDIPAVLAAYPGEMRVVAKRSLLRMPFIGWHLFLAGHFLIDRDDPRAGRALLERAARRLVSRRLSALVFGEGTRSRDGRLQPLKAGTFLLPLAAGVPVVPAAVLGTHAAMPRGAFAPERRGTIEVRFGAPIPTAGLSGGPARKSLAAAVRASLLALGVPDGAAGGPVEGEAAR
jgi:1-acyl-sn-glycerol-3-phosphate acyltransferase